MDHSLQDRLRVCGRVRVICRDCETGEVHTLITHNLVTDSGLNLIADLLAQQPGVTGITHLAVGTGNTQPTATDTALEAEVYRTNVTREWRSSTGTAEIETYLQRAVANVDVETPLREIGLFAGDTLYARALFPAPIPKSKKHDLLISWWSSITPEVG